MNPEGVRICPWGDAMKYNQWRFILWFRVYFQQVKIMPTDPSLALANMNDVSEKQLFD